MAPRSPDPRVDRLVQLFEHLSLADVAQLGDFYANDVRFKDPFNDVQDLASLQAMFTHMFTSLESPRFVVRDIVQQDDQCFMTWNFLFRFKRLSREPQTVRGASHLRFDANGRVCLHRDYWDAAEELYEKLPLVDRLMRWLKRRAVS